MVDSEVLSQHSEIRKWLQSGLRSCGSLQGPDLNSCEPDKEPSNFIKGGKLHDQLGNFVSEKGLCCFVNFTFQVLLQGFIGTMVDVDLIT
jgi:hypothetical protein